MRWNKIILSGRNSFWKGKKLIFVCILILLPIIPYPIRIEDFQFYQLTLKVSEAYQIHDPISVTNNEELAAVVNGGEGTIEDPYLITGWNITGAPAEGIYITGTTKYFLITNCLIQGSSYEGIFIHIVAAGTATIANNTCTHNNEDGIHLGLSPSSVVDKNTCEDNGGSGIDIFSSNNSIVSNNTCKTNDGWRIDVWHSSSLTIYNNTCSKNHIGIRLIYSDNNSIFLNYLFKNNIFGVHIALRSDNNNVFHNTFIDNRYSESQAYDEGEDNQWYNQITQEGNYWSDYSGKGSYLIAGPAETSDLYPLNTKITVTTQQIHTSKTPAVPPIFPFDSLVILMVGGGILGLIFILARKSTK